MDELRPGLVRPVRLDSTGRDGPTRSQVRNTKRWRRSSHGFYVPAWVDADNVEQRILEASVLVPEGCAITGWAALRWLGGAWFSGTDAVGKPLPITALVSSQGIRQQPGIIVCGEGTSPDNMVLVDGVPVTIPAWSTAFMMRRLPSPREAVMAFDMAAYSDLVSLAEVAEVISHQSSWTGVPQARWALDRGCENAWSPREVFMRLAWEASREGVQLVANPPIFDLDGLHIGTPDVVDLAAGVLGEYDGVVHMGREQRRVDRTRDEVFARHGLEVVRMMSGDRVDDFLARLHGAYARVAAREGPQLWTATPPPNWVSTATVDARRALTAEQQARFLRYRIA